MEIPIINNTSGVYTVSGQITHKESQLGIPNLTVLIYDLEKEELKIKNQPKSLIPADLVARIKASNRLGNVITDQHGHFSFSYGNEDITAFTDGKRRLNLYIIVLAPEDEDTQPFSNVLYYSKSIRSNAGKHEQFRVSISTKTLVEKEVPIPKLETVDDRIKKYIDQKQQNEAYEKALFLYNHQKRVEDRAEKAEAINKIKENLSHNGTKWIQMPGSDAVKIAGGNGSEVWMVNKTGKIYSYFNGKWNQMRGSSGKGVAIGNDNSIWLTNAKGEIYKWNGAGWSQIYGSNGSAISVNDNKVFLVNTLGKIYKLEY